MPQGRNTQIRVQNHLHKLKRYKYGNGAPIYFCTLPDCSFRSPVALMLGKKVLCNQCGNPFVMNENSIRRAKPHCENCSRRKVTDENGAIRYVHQRIELDNAAEKVDKNLLDSKIDDIKRSITAAVSFVPMDSARDEDDEDI